jgi:glycosyltransferase involved in cell wall biosynthesis
VPLKRRIRIAFDDAIFVRQSYGGISRYVVRLAEHLSRLNDCHVDVLAPWHINAYLRRNHGYQLHGVRLPRFRYTGRLRHAFSERIASAWLRGNPPNIVHETYYRPRRNSSSQSAIVVTVYDMIHELLPEFFSPQDPTPVHKAAAVARADHVICLSETTKHDLLELMQVDPAKVSVVYLGHEVDGFGDFDVATCSSPYVLYVGMRGGYKNFDTLLRAFARRSALRRQVRIVCFGGEPSTAGDMVRIRELGLDDCVEFRHGDDRDLRALYKSACVLVSTSFYEGFGLPPLEAMALGCPVVCSNAGSMPEVVGNAAQLFDPHDPDSLSQALEALLSDTTRRAELQRLGLARAAEFSWQRCAAETLSVYRQVAGRS